MAVYELTLPLDDATVEKLQVGDIIYLNGQVCTARDIAHLKLRELADAGKPFPEDLRGGAIFHAGPVMKKDAQGKWYLSVIGPTTSIRMEPHADFVGQQGVKVIIGKGGMGEGTMRGCRDNKALHCVFPAGCAVVAATCVEKILSANWKDLGMPETLWTCQVKEFGPLIVSIDTHGRNLFEENKVIFNERKEKVFQEIASQVGFIK